jgi:hypothetical protein
VLNGVVNLILGVLSGGDGPSRAFGSLARLFVGIELLVHD